MMTISWQNFKILVHTMGIVYNTPSLKGSLWQTLWFNFKYLPLHQAWRLPIFLHKADTRGFKGKIVIERFIDTGRIILGSPLVDLYPDTGIRISGCGTIVFQGHCNIHSGAYISMENNSLLTFGDCFFSSQGLKLACCKKISFDRNVIVGWECRILDSDFHQLEDLEGNKLSPKESPITIGEGCWLAQNCTLLKGVNLPPSTIVASNSLVNKSVEQPFCMIGGIPAKVIRQGVRIKRE